MNEQRICFVSGHMDLTNEEFEKHYAPRISAAHAGGAYFVIGDANGCDFMAQQLLLDLDRRSNRMSCSAAVYHMLDMPRCTVGVFQLTGGFKSDEERDAAMTSDSTEDIAWVRSAKKKRNSGTAKNIERRERFRKEVHEKERATWPRFDVTDLRYDDGERRIFLSPPYAGGPSVPLPQQLVDELKLAEDRLADAECEVRRLSNKVRDLIKEEESSR